MVSVSEKGLTEEDGNGRPEPWQGVFVESFGACHGGIVTSGDGGPMTAVFAHRGCTEGFTENTIEAFVEARRLGADGVELDVRLTADGAPGRPPRCRDPRARRHRRARGGRPAGPRAAAGRRPGRVRGHGGQRRDQERPAGPGLGRRRGRGGPHGGRHRRGRLDRRGCSCPRSRSATLRAVQAADGRLALGCPLGFRHRAGARAGSRGGGGVRRRPSVRAVRGHRRWSSGPMQWGLPSTSGPSTPRGPARHGGAGVDAVITDRLDEALVIAG